MPRAFLSHSSKQKGYVDVVASQLSKENIVYDKFNFEAGGKTIDEIYRGLGESDIFVFFISDEALKSDWVDKEIKKAETLFKDGTLKRLLPILIDNKIDYKDSRIPLWMKDNYNLQYVSRPTKSVERIKQSLKLLSWELYPINKRLNQLFIGRSELIRKFEERVFNFELNVPISILASGFPSIGRRKFMLHSLKNTNKIPDYYTPPIIVLNSRDSIENFILNLYDLGYSETRDLKNLITKTIEEKVEIAFELVSDLVKNNIILFIIDNYSIVGQDGNVVEWYADLSKKLFEHNRILICTASRSRVKAHNLFGKDYIFNIEVPELSKHERNSLFQALLEIDNIQLDKEQILQITNLFLGFPEQIFYALSIIKSSGVAYLIDNLHLLVEYNSSKVAQIVIEYIDKPEASDLLRLLAEFEFISIDFLFNIIGDETPNYKDFITRFSYSAIIEYIGASKEYIRLNDSVRDHILRTGQPIKDSFQRNLKQHAEVFIKDYLTIDKDISDFNYSIQYALEEGNDVPQEYLIPSHFLNTMKELYDNKRKYSDVVKLADRVLENSYFIDKRILREIMYWLCLALARTRNDRFLKDVQKIDGPDHNFLLGFYYRLKGQNEKAIERLNEVLRYSPYFYRAKRELVQVYLNIDDYESAYQLAKENYENDRSNPYYAQSYFRCLVKLRKDNRDNPEIEKVLNALAKIRSDKAQEMHFTAKAQYEAFVKSNREEALGQIDLAIETYPDNIHPKLTKIDICIKFREKELLEKLIKELETNHIQSDIYSSIIMIGKVKLYALKGLINEATVIIDTKLKYQLPDYAVQKLINEINKY